MNIKSKKGVTLVEMVVAVAILGIIMVPISLLFTTAYTNFIAESDKVTAQQSAREVLYGKGMSSYGIIGDLERSDATATDGLIKIGKLLDASNPNKGQSISITEVTATGTGHTKIYYYMQEATTPIWKLKCKIIAPDGIKVISDIDYFADDKSTNDRAVEVTAFVVEKITKGTDIDPDTNKVIIMDTDLIKVTITVACGRSSDVTLESSYRIPNIE